MKLTYKNTALGLLDNMNASSFTISEDSEHTPIEYKRRLGFSLIHEWPKMKERFAKKIQYISDPFFEAYNVSASKLANIITQEQIHESGTFVSRAIASEYNTIFYDIHTFEKPEYDVDCLILFFSKDNKREKPSLNIFLHRTAEGTKSFFSQSADAAGVTEISILADLITLILFMRYVELETKFVNANKRQYHVGTKYVNETKHNVEILDSTWFTTIVRSEGFKVGGHFRLQPIGPGRSERKLIWIDPFEKHGYTRHAKILNQ